MQRPLYKTQALLIALSLLALHIGCSATSSAKGASATESIAVSFSPQDRTKVSVVAELALTPAQQRKGLMYRRQLKADHGMLFVFADEQPRSFWMKNTYIPLDMIFLNNQKKVVSIVEHAEPLTESPRESILPAKYVLEVNAGFSKQHRIQPGMHAEF